MRRQWKLALSLGPILGAALIVVPAATTSGPGSVSGAWSTKSPIPTGFKQAGVNIKLPGVVFSAWSGDLHGTTVAIATFLIQPDGSVVAAPTRETFTGTVSGVGTGTLDFVEEAHGQPDGSTEIGATIVRGTGELAGLHGRLIFLGSCDLSGACAGRYSGEIKS